MEEKGKEREKREERTKLIPFVKGGLRLCRYYEMRRKKRKCRRWQNEELGLTSRSTPSCAIRDGSIVSIPS